MTGSDEQETDYTDAVTSRLETIWGEGFLSPGGAAEVARVLGPYSIEGSDILDIGCGTGGIDVALVRAHGAGTVVGIDVEKKSIDLADRRLAKHGLQDRIKYQLVDPGPLPFPNETFDFVFSKDAIIHIQDKRGLYGEAFRVIRPGGQLIVSDWLRGVGEKFDKTVEKFVEASGHEFTLVSLGDVGEIITDLGFVDIDLSSRREWYLKEASAELEKMRGPLQEQLHEEIEFWEIMIDALGQGAIMPGHIRATRPANTR